MSKSRFAFLLPALLWAYSCTSYQQRMAKAERAFFAGNPTQAVSEIKSSAAASSDKDKLLYYMEAGIAYHTAGDYRKSNEVLAAADELIRSYRSNLGDKVGSFLISDKSAPYVGEPFEQILVNWYRALNHVLLNEQEQARRLLLRLESDLRELKYEKEPYMQVLAARYLLALLAEQAGDFNTSRVQYRNLELFGMPQDWLKQQRYYLALKEKDTASLKSLLTAKPAIITPAGERPIEPQDSYGQLVFIHQAGKAPVKKSRGKLSQDEKFWLAMRLAIEAALYSEGALLTTTTAMAALGFAENPIPKYESRDKAATAIAELKIGDLKHQLPKLTDYEEMALRNFNDNYDTMVGKNVTSLALKFTLAAIAAYHAGEKAEEAAGGGLGGFLVKAAVGAGAGAGVAATLQPDLRSWRLLPANIQMQRLVLTPGSYPLELILPANSRVASELPKNITIQAGETIFLSVRSFTPEQP